MVKITVKYVADKLENLEKGLDGVITDLQKQLVNENMSANHYLATQTRASTYADCKNAISQLKSIIAGECTDTDTISSEKK